MGEESGHPFKEIGEQQDPTPGQQLGSMKDFLA